MIINNQSTRLRLGIIGCGRAAEYIYMPAIKKNPEIEVTAVVDPVEDRRVLLSKYFSNCQIFDSIEKNFFYNVDACIICTPPDTHVPLAIEVLKNNKFVLLEKPLSISKDRITELINAEQNSNASLMMAFNHRYWLPISAIKEKLSNFSNILSVEIFFEGNYSNWNPVSFKSDPLDDLGPHVFDMINFLFCKNINSITASSIDHNYINYNIKLHNDITISGHVAYTKNTKKELKIKTEKEDFYIRLGSIRIQPHAGYKRIFFDIKDSIKRKLYRETSPIKLSYDIQLRNYTEFAKSNKSGLPGIEAGIYALSACEAARLSLNNNSKEIFLNEIKF